MPPKFTSIKIGFWSIVGHSAAAGAEHGGSLIDCWDRCRAEEVR
jgi:hypothetical protein